MKATDKALNDKGYWVDIAGTVYRLNDDEERAEARQALADAGQKPAEIWDRPSDEPKAAKVGKRFK